MGGKGERKNVRKIIVYQNIGWEVPLGKHNRSFNFLSILKIIL